MASISPQGNDFTSFLLLLFQEGIPPPHNNDSSLFTNMSAFSIVLLAIYVDDIPLASNDSIDMVALKSFLDQQFKIKDLGSLHYFLGLEDNRVPQGYIVNQYKYTMDLLQEFHCLDVEPVLIPLDLHSKLSHDGILFLIPHCIGGSLASSTSSNTPGQISPSHYNISASFLVSPKVPHMLVALHVLRYLFNAPFQGILFSNTTDFTL